MRVDLTPRDQYFHLVDQIQEKLSPRVKDEKAKLRIYSSLFHGLNEVTKGLAQLFPHKKSMAYIKGMGPYFSPLLPSYSREGMNVQSIEFSDMNSPEKVLESLKDDTLFVLLSIDDPLTGRKFQTEALELALNEKKIFTVRLSHNSHRFFPDLTPKSPYSLGLYSVTSKLALGIFGSRGKFEPLIHGENYFPIHIMDDIDSAFERMSDSKDQIQKFEKGFEEQAPLLNEQGRIFDRSVLVFKDIDGYALIDQISHKIGRELSPAGFDSAFETSSICRWSDTQFVGWLSEQGFTSEQIRGLVVISAEQITPELSDQIRAAVNEILEIQQG